MFSSLIDPLAKLRKVRAESARKMARFGGLLREDTYDARLASQELELCSKDYLY